MCLCYIYAVETSLSVAIKTQSLRIVTHEEKKKKNEIISAATATEHSHRIKWLAQPLSHQQNRGCDMVLSFVTLKNVQHKMNANGRTVEQKYE